MTTFENLVDYRLLARVVHKERDAPRCIDQWIREGDAMGIELGYEVANNISLRLLQRCCLREQGRGMPVSTKSEKDQIMRVPSLTESRCERMQKFFVIGRGLVRIDLALHTVHFAWLRQREQ